jgi:hypothetical protein
MKPELGGGGGIGGKEHQLVLPKIGHPDLLNEFRRQDGRTLPGKCGHLESFRDNRL